MLRSLLIVLLLQSVWVSAASKGSCPPMPTAPSRFVPAERGQSVPPQDGAEYVGTITMFSVISEKGFVCDVKVLSGIDSPIDQRALAQLAVGGSHPPRRTDMRLPLLPRSA